MGAGMSHADYLDEPAETIDWMLALDGMRAKIEKEQLEQAREQASRGRRR